MQGAGIGAETPDGGLPHDGGVHVEHQVEIHVRHQPRRLGELVVQLARAPSRIAGQHARARSWMCLENAAQQRRGRGQIQPVHDRPDVRVRRLFPDENPPAIGLHRTTRAESQPVALFDRRLEPHHRSRRHIGGAIEHQAECPLGKKVTQQHDRLREVWILKLGHREQQRRPEHVAHYSYSLPATFNHDWTGRLKSAASPPPR